MGGGTIIPGTKDIVIPAFTDIELTVKGVTSANFGIDYGIVTVTSTQERIMVWHDLGVVPKFAALIKEPMNYPLIEATIASIENRTLYTATHDVYLYLKSNYIEMEKSEDKVTFEAFNYIYRDTIKYINFAAGTYRWIAIA